MPGKAAMLDRYLRDKDMPTVRETLDVHDNALNSNIEDLAKNLAPRRHDRTPEYKEIEVLDEDNVETHIDLERVKQFLALNPPFAELVDNLRKQLEPVLIMPPVNVEELKPEPPLKQISRGPWRRIIVMI